MAGRTRQPRSVLERGLMTTNITPDKARALLRGDFASDAHQTNVGNLEAGTIITGAYIFGTPGDFALTEAAPALAHTVAHMHYEYAVQGPDGRWVRETDDRKLELTIDPMRALRRYNPFIIERLAEAASAQFNGECRIVRRLVSDPEVVE